LQRNREVRGRGHLALTPPADSTPRNRRAAVWALSLGLLGGGCGGGSDDGAPSSQADQVAAGEAVYAESCAKCHGANGEGGTGPVVIGGNKRIASYQTTERLYDYISRTMPFDAPGSLSEDQYWNVIAFLLDRNQLLPEEAVLGPDTEPIQLER
jgi:polar amino acid transport system substrate-binding protein